MPHSYYNVWVHAVFATKNRNPIITTDIEEQLYSCLYTEFKSMDCTLKIVNGLPDHVHCLFMIGSQRSISEVIKHIKGLSSHFLNMHFINSEKFAWQKGYAAFSVSESRLEVVYRYIKDQKIKMKSLEDEGFDFLIGKGK
jgi:REP element-mobilizing transposase RayT